jgi:DNA-binding transcriptional ArsR family regulator
MPNPAPAFGGFSNPNYTMVPDQLFDELLPELSGAELKVLLYIIRRTFGFKRESDAISISQLLGGITTADGRVLDRGVGLSKPALLAALRSLTEKGIIISERQQSAQRGNEPTVYCLCMRTQAEGRQAVGAASRPPLVKKVYQAPLVKKSDTPLVKKVNPQYTGIQDTEYSNIRKEEISKDEKETESNPYAETTIVVEEEAPPEQERAKGLTPSRTTSPTALADVLAHPSAGRRAAGSGERDAIMACIAQFAQEFGDRATLKSSTSRAVNLYRQAAIPQKQFVNCLWEARAITRERLSEGRGASIRSKMGYFFSVLAERLDVGSDEAPTGPVKASPDSGPSKSSLASRQAVTDSYSAPQPPSQERLDDDKTSKQRRSKAP